MKKNPFLAGVGKVLIFKGQNLIGVGTTNTENTFNHSISNTEIRGGRGNALLGKYFYDSNLAVTITNALFDFNEVAMSLGLPVESGGLSVYESAASGETCGEGGAITLTNAPAKFDGELIAWYKKPNEAEWSVATVEGIGTYTITPNGASQGDVYCIKYFYINDSAKQITLKVDRVPDIVHITILNDLFSGDATDIANSAKAGRLITDLPAFQFDGGQDLSLSSTSAATVSLSGNALAINSSDTCEEENVYGTMTQELYGEDWRNEAIALAAVNSEIELDASDSETETAVIYAVFGGNVASARKDNKYFTFTQDSGSSTYFSVSNTGVITALAAGSGTIEVAIKNDGETTFDVPPTFIQVTVVA